MPSTTNYDTLSEQIETTTAENVLSDKTFAEIFTQENEVYRERLINKLRTHAKALGVSMKAFDSILSAHRKFSRQYEKDKQTEQNKKLRGVCHTPDWLDDMGKINEVAFCKGYLEFHEMKCINGLFYGDEGSIPEEQIENSIQSVITPFVTKNVAKTVRSLVAALKMLCYSAPPEPNLDEINLQNGTLALNGTFLPTKKFCVNRLNVNYIPDPVPPVQWLRFLKDLLIPEDILTLQEYLGYCLIPSTRAQVMLFIIGNGGEGKSQIGNVMAEMFRGSMVSGSLNDLEENKYALATLENKLLFLDDDLSIKASEDSKNLKRIVTASAPILIERKNVQPYESLLYARIMAFGNVSLRLLFDHSDGIFRRQIILKAKPKPANRVDNRNLSDELMLELDDIFSWCFQGLQRLMKNNFQFTISQQAKDNLEESREENCNVIKFMKDTGYLCRDQDGAITGRRIALLYQQWCRENEEAPLKGNSVIAYLKSNVGKFQIEYDKHIKFGNKDVRGFRGLRQVADLTSDSYYP